MPGQPEAVAQPPHRGRDHAEVLGDDRQAAERLRRRVEHGAPRPAAPAPAQRGARALRHRPVGDEAAEVVDPRAVEQRERAREPRDPPGVAAPLQRRPVVERVAPELALVRVGVGRRAGDGVVAEQLRVRAVVGRAGRDVDRHVADQPHAALVRVRAQRRPLALEAHLVGDRAAAGEARPVLDPARLALAEVELLGLRDRRRRLGEEPRPGRERRRRLVRRAVAVGRPERQHLPPRLAGVGEPVDPGERVAAEPAAGQRGGVELDAGGAGQTHGAAP